MTQQMDNDAVEVRDVETVFQGHFRVDRYRMRIRRFDGGWSEEFRREIFVSGSAVVVILYDPHEDSLVLVEQFRLAPFVRGDDCWMLEYVAGKIEPGAVPEETARQETLEEAGCEIQRIEKIAEYYVSAGSADEYITLFIAQVDSTKAGGVFGLAEEHEDIRVRVMPADKVIAMADAAQLPNMNTLLATLWLARHRDDLKKRWK